MCDLGKSHQEDEEAGLQKQIEVAVFRMFLPLRLGNV